MSDPSSQPTQPLTAQELAEIRESAEWAISANNAFRLLNEVDRLRAENTALRAKAASAWSEGSAHALGQVLDHEDQFRANLGVLLVAEERRCQLAINEEPLNFHLHGHLSGLKRARDIVTGDAFRALGLDQDGRGQ